MNLWWLIVLCALVTYATRVGGHLALLRFRTLHPRVEAALDAVPVAVLTALVAPAAVGRGPVELAAMIVAGLVGLRLSILWVVLVGLVVLVLGRQLV